MLILLFAICPAAISELDTKLFECYNQIDQCNYYIAEMLFSNDSRNAEKSFFGSQHPDSDLCPIRDQILNCYKNGGKCLTLARVIADVANGIAKMTKLACNSPARACARRVPDPLCHVEGSASREADKDYNRLMAGDTTGTKSRMDTACKMWLVELQCIVQTWRKFCGNNAVHFYIKYASSVSEDFNDKNNVQVETAYGTSDECQKLDSFIALNSKASTSGSKTGIGIAVLTSIWIIFFQNFA